MARKMSRNCLAMASIPLSLAEAIALLLEDITAVRDQRPRLIDRVRMQDRLQALDLFEMMIRVDDLGQSAGLTGSCPELERWAELEPETLGRRLTRESGSVLLATLLVLSPKSLARLAPSLSFLRWMEVARALNNVSPEQLAFLPQADQLQSYLLGQSNGAPNLNMPWMFPLPLPSILRVVQSGRFRMGLVKPEGQAEAWRRYARFFSTP